MMILRFEEQEDIYVCLSHPKQGEYYALCLKKKKGRRDNYRYLLVLV